MVLYVHARVENANNFDAVAVWLEENDVRAGWEFEIARPELRAWASANAP